MKPSTRSDAGVAGGSGVAGVAGGAGGVSGAGGAGGAEQCQTDESKAQHSASARLALNLEDERKQQAARTPCLADSGNYTNTITSIFYQLFTLLGSKDHVEDSQVMSLILPILHIGNFYCTVTGETKSYSGFEGPCRKKILSVLVSVLHTLFLPSTFTVQSLAN